MLKRMVNVFERCLRDAHIFERNIAGGRLFESVETKKSGQDWAILSAGDSKADRPTVPISLIGSGEMQLRMVLRPISWPTAAPHPTGLVTHYAPGDGVPFVEIHSGFIRVEFPGIDIGLSSLRWEVDVIESLQDPMEAWLRPWRGILGYNPAHAPSHLHFNSEVFASGRARGRPDTSVVDLRLALGSTNPLAFLLSTAAWLRAGGAG